MYTAPGFVRLSLLPSTKRRPPPLVELFPVDLATWDDGVWGDPAFLEWKPDDLDEPWPYRFQNGDKVWLCTSDGDWCRGRIVGQPKRGKLTKSALFPHEPQEEGLYWCAEFQVARVRVRKWLGPLNGEIKPDSAYTLELLEKAGIVGSDSEHE